MAFSSLSHAQRVCRLYKKAIRHLQSFYVDRLEFRYEAVLMRARFDQHKDEKNPIKYVKLLEDGEEEFRVKQHPQPYIFIDSQGGTRYERNLPSPEWVLDHWHPTEKAQYPYYFAKYEKRRADEKARWLELLEEEKKLVDAGEIPPPPPKLQ